MPFGLCNALDTSQRLIRVVLSGLEGTSCFVDLDDILIVSSTFEEHLHHSCQVFERLHRAGLRFKPKKCFLLRKEVAYLGYIVFAAGIKPDPTKVDRLHQSYRYYQSVIVSGPSFVLSKLYSAFAKITHSVHALTRRMLSSSGMLIVKRPLVC